MALSDHLAELRARLLKSLFVFALCFAVTFTWSEEIYDFLAAPLAEALRAQGRDAGMIYTGLPEAFLTYVRVALFAALFVAFPYLANQLWRFTAPGLYRRERRAFLPFLVATPFLFASGAALAYFVVLPLAWRFLTAFAGGEAAPIRLEARVSEYLSLTITMLFAFGVAFLLPVLLALVARAGLVRAHDLAGKRKYAVVLAFIAAAVLTPPDVVSQILLATPLLVLYEISIFAVRLIEKRARAKERRRRRHVGHSAHTQRP